MVKFLFIKYYECYRSVLLFRLTFCGEKKQNTTVLYADATRRTRVEWFGGGVDCIEECLESRKEGRFIQFE